MPRHNPLQDGVPPVADLATSHPDGPDAADPGYSMQLDELFQRLKECDRDWLTQTLYERSSHVLHQENGLQEQVNLAQKSTWPLDVTLGCFPQDLELPEYVHFFRSFDWSSTDLGPMSEWTCDLRRTVNMCLSDKRASVIWIGSNRLGIYNEGYSIIAGHKHPWYLGKSFEEMWSEPGVVEHFGAILSAGLKFGHSSKGDDVPFILDRYGFREETWVSFTVVPAANSTGEVFANYNTVIDTTAGKLHQRRLSTMLALGEKTSVANNVGGFWQTILDCCATSPGDIPFAMIYSRDSSISASTSAVAKHMTGTSSSDVSDRELGPWKLAGQVGLDEALAGFPEELDSDAAASLFSSAFTSAITTGEAVVLKKADKTWPQPLGDAARSPLYGDICHTAVLLPINPTNLDGAVGFILVGINPLAVYNAEYQQFIELLGRQCSTALASVMLIEEEMIRARTLAELAAQDRNQLTAQLAETRQEVLENEHRFRQMADMAPVAMFQLDEHGNILYVNKTWVELTDHPHDHWGSMSWFEVVHPDDQDIVDKEWTRLLEGHPVSFEMRWKKPFAPEHDKYFSGELVEGATWTLASAYAEKRADGSVKGILGCLTDISRQKWMAGFQDRRMSELVELKRQQENFMDMTSHEARNPLSAITLCAESLLTALKELHDEQRAVVSIDRASLEMHLESAEIIMACAQHQKRIIDDVLTLSKLDSGLLIVAPIEMQPAKAIAEALKMFDGEVLKHDIKLSLEIDESYGGLEIDWVKQDPSRLLQILINLLANAIKFTQSEDVRRITVTLSACQSRPTKSLHGIEYINNSWSLPRPAEEEHCVYIGLEIIDTGRGMTGEEMKRLFHKFQQASPKTNVEYGGSGLGLFISRQLTRMLGGAIGVASDGRGATFAFYMMAARCAAPENTEHKPKPKPTDSSDKGDTTSPVNETRRSSVNESAIELVDTPAAMKNHILVVEDNLINQKVMRNQLERMQYVVTVANHGLEALEHICKTQFYKSDGVPLDFVLMDVEMPVCNGLECARRIRQMQHAGQLKGHVPIIGVTANARAEQQMAAKDAGMDSVVTKPFRLMTLNTELEKMALHLT